VRGSLTWVAIVVVVGGCDDGRGRRPTASADAGGTDARPMDAGLRSDGALGDADAPPDGSWFVDGGVEDGGRPDASADAGGNDAGAPITICRLGCAVVADCDTGSPAFDADNYDCTARGCEYRGCNTDAECVATFASSEYGCASADGTRACLERCGSAVDCGSGTPAFDADNYRCASGYCRYDGCRNDGECVGTFGSGYVCATTMPPDIGLPIPTATRNCVRGCVVRADCTTGTAAFDADNYECVAGSCRYTGCTADSECHASFSSTRYVCR
jgi:hypothetical protein